MLAQCHYLLFGVVFIGVVFLCLSCLVAGSLVVVVVVNFAFLLLLLLLLLLLAVALFVVVVVLSMLCLSRCCVVWRRLAFGVRRRSPR
jgi:hypothetical protein